MVLFWALTLAVAGAAPAPAWAQTPARSLSPAELRAGAVPSLPLLSVAAGGGEVILELRVSDRGSVTSVRPLRTTASFTQMVTESVRTWRFAPAEEAVDPVTRTPGSPAIRRVASTVTVAALFRPPSFHGPTLGEAVADVGAASRAAPFPISTTTPAFPPRALLPGVVLIEARVDGAGVVVGLKVRRSAPPFDEPALDAARQWKFRPAHAGGTPVASLAYLLFGFQSPQDAN